MPWGERHGAAVQGLQEIPGGSQPLPCGTKQRLRVWGLGGFQGPHISPRAPFGRWEQGSGGYSQPLGLPGGGEGAFGEVLG